MKTKVRIIKQNNPLERENYQERHEKSLIDILVPQHIEYAIRVVEEAKRRSDVLVSTAENFRMTR